MLRPAPALALMFGAGVMLVWLSFFLMGGFMFLDETNIGSSSALLALKAVVDGLLRFLKTGS